MEKVTVTCSGEFSVDLVLAVPYAYWLHQRGLLEGTVSAVDSRPMYYFSPHHEERFFTRTVNNQEGLKGLPNDWIHHNATVSEGRPGILDFSQWEMPPFKQHYANDIFVFDKPLLVISNKYAWEWGQPPVNFLDCEVLDTLITLLSPKYHLVYKRPVLGDYPPDQNEIIPTPTPLHDYELCRMRGVTTLRDLQDQHPEMSYNELQFKLFANCDHYISVQGGNSHICALFGRTNINYIVRGKELTPGYFDEGTWYRRMNGCNTIPVSTYDDLIAQVKHQYL